MKNVLPILVALVIGLVGGYFIPRSSSNLVAESYGTDQDLSKDLKALPDQAELQAPVLDAITESSDPKQEINFYETWCNCDIVTNRIIGGGAQAQYNVKDEKSQVTRRIIRTEKLIKEMTIEYLNEKSFCNEGQVASIIYIQKTYRKPSN